MVAEPGSGISGAGASGGGDELMGSGAGGVDGEVPPTSPNRDVSPLATG